MEVKNTLMLMVQFATLVILILSYVIVHIEAPRKT
ncbi:putative holin-like toxin [Paenibacillus sp. JJ-223]|nr:hypothetical protein PAECIP111890_01816 [Paenibacillus sp. JJ-223]